MKKKIISAVLTLSLVAGIITSGLPGTETGKAAANDSITEGSEKEAYIMCYTREIDDSVKGRSGGKHGMYQSATTDSMHLAYSEDGEDFEALNNNTGVLFPKNDGDDTKVIRQPYIFRMKDGTFGVIAVRYNEAGTVPDKKGCVILFASEDLLSYEEKGTLMLSGKDYVSYPSCEYDKDSDSYIIRWTGIETGISYEDKTTDLVNIGSENECDYRKETCPDPGIEYAIPGNVIKVSTDEAKKIHDKLSPVINTTIDQPVINTKPGESVELGDKKVIANYSDGSSAEKCVAWNEDDINKVDFSKEGSYTVRGEIIQLADKISDTGNYPFIPGRADPNVVYFNGKYYFTATNESGNVNLYIRESDTVAGLNDSKENLIYDEEKGLEGNIISKSNHWAPELHVINNELYMLFASNIGTGWDVQSCIMKLKTGGDPKKYEDWEAPKRYLDKDGKNLNTYCGGITLDMTHFSYNDRDYVVWSQRNFGKNGGTADLWIGETTADNPGQLISEPVLIVNCEYGWERNNDTPVTEGPNVIIRDDVLYLTYSGGATDESYCVGMTQIRLSENVDFLDAGAWKKTNYPLLTGLSARGNIGYHGPGHNSYVTDEDGDLINVFHARPGDGSQFARDAFLRRVHFGADGEPVLDMEEDYEILPENKAVTMTVNVQLPKPDDSGNANNVDNSNNTNNSNGTGTTNSATSSSITGRTTSSGSTQASDAGKNGSPSKSDKGTRFTVGKMTYKITSSAKGKKTVELVKCSDKKASKITIPSTVKHKKVTYKVTSIAAKAFYKNIKLKQLVIGKNVTKIGKKTFYGCKNLKKINVKSKRLGTIGSGAFKGVNKNVLIKGSEKIKTDL